MTAAGAGGAGVLGLHRHEDATVPCQLVRQLAAELEPTLVENGAIEAGFRSHIRAWMFDNACRRVGHVPHLQVLDTRHRMLFSARQSASGCI